MKIFISVDIEGISGVVNPIECKTEDSNGSYQQARKWCTGDVNAAIEGALEAGATAIVVNDSHGLRKMNIIYDELNPKASLVRGGPNILLPNDFLTGIDNTFDAVLLVGWHDKIGGKGVLSHTYTAKDYNDIRVNGKSFGEVDFAAALAGTFSVPVTMISGDDVICKRTKEDYKDVEVAPVKRMLSRFSAECLPLKEAQRLIKEAAYRAVRRAAGKEFTPLSPEKEYLLEIEAHDAAVARTMSRIPGVGYDNRLTVSYRSEDFRKIYDMLLVMFFLKEIATNDMY